MSASPLPVILVGCGAVSRLFYAPSLLELARLQVLRTIAVVDPSADARATLAKSLGAAPFATLAEALALGRDGLVIVASPPRWHAEQTLAALAGGWHVLCEKPMAASGAEADKMTAAASAAGRTLAIGHYKRFFPSSRYLKFLCGSSAPLGPLLRFSIAEGGPFTWPAASPTFFQKRETPGGVLLDIGVHALDLLLWWLGQPSDFSYADDAMGGLETNARLSLRFGSVSGQVQLSRDWATPQRYDFFFERGEVSWTVNDANGVSVLLNGAPCSLRSTLREADGLAAATNPQSFVAQLRHVVGAIQERSSILVDGLEGARALHLIEACYARRTLLEQPWLSPAEVSNARLWATAQ